MKDTHPQIKFDVFERLNTGSVKLNPQELRHGLYQGDMTKIIEKLSMDKLWKEFTSSIKDKRMKSEELILRFLALEEHITAYKEPMVTFLNDYLENNKTLSDEKSVRLQNKFNTVFGKVHLLFGHATFRIVTNDLKIKNFNAALMDAEMLSISVLNPTNEQINNCDRDKLIRELAKLIEEEKFNSYITAATTFSRAVRGRVEIFSEFLRSHLG